MIIFGPVPSRRLGRSLGINHIPPKSCTYSCVYCQLGRTRRLELKPRAFFTPDTVLQIVQKRISEVEAVGEAIDYLTFVPDGEPTLDIHLGEIIDLVRGTGKKIAVISNSSLIWRESVRDALQKADWISLKVDSVCEETWRKINRPHDKLDLMTILEGIAGFSEIFEGTLVTETMFIRDVNDDTQHLERLAEFLGRFHVDTSYLSIPIRPPAEKWVQPPAEESMINAYRILSEDGRNLEYLIGYEGNVFASTGDAAKDLLSITAVHPMREEAVELLLKKAGADWSVVDRLVKDGLLVTRNFQDHVFYARKLFTRGGKGMEGLRSE